MQLKINSYCRWCSESYEECLCSVNVGKLLCELSMLRFDFKAGDKKFLRAMDMKHTINLMSLSNDEIKKLLELREKVKQ